jgi:hypothetical protein
MKPTRRRFLQGATAVAAGLLLPQHAAAAQGLRESRIEGSNLTMLALPGPVTVLLTHLVRRYLYEIDHTVAPHEFRTGYRSGTALAIRPVWYPVGVAGGYCPRDLTVLRDILADFDGVVRWGGDLRPVNEAWFQIDVPAGHPALHRIAARIASWNQAPDHGAGVLVDPATPSRRSRALALASRQEALPS